MTSGWPNSSTWSALQQRDLPMGARTYRLSVVDCGNLYLPSGHLVACDPFAGLRRTGNPFVEVPPGTYPVRVTVADISENLDGSHLREAYASLVLAPTPEVSRATLTPLLPGDEPPVLASGDFIGFSVDAGTACFVDSAAVVEGMPPEEEWHEGLFENSQPDCWFARMDDPRHIQDGIANIVLPLAKSGENLVLFHSGWGDGTYPVVGGYGESGELVAVHIDFIVIPPDEDMVPEA